MISSPVISLQHSLSKANHSSKAMEFKAFVYLIALFAVSITLSLVHAGEGGFTVDLIHHDSPKSPFYNPDETHFDRLRAAFKRSIARSNAIDSPHQVQSPIIHSGGAYVMSLSLGTPPVEIFAVADTGSDLIWTQCKPCYQCYEQDRPLFDPKGSKTYKDLACESRPCIALGGSITRCYQDTCLYSVRYGDQSFSDGKLASETFTLGSTDKRPVTIPNSVFGCGHYNDGTFNKNDSGIVGLGGGPLSLVSQLNTQINGKFSYCLLPYTSNTASKLNFGSNGIVSGKGVVSTPLVSKEPNTFYYLTLEGISVGEKKSTIKKSCVTTNAIGTEEGNIIIDSGTTLTLFPPELYDDFETYIKEAIKLDPVESPDPNLKLCYKASRVEDITIPPVTVHFTGADVELAAVNTFIAVQEGVICLALIPTPQSLGISIYRNIAQINFLVGYDIKAGTVSFQPTNCAKPNF